MGMLDGLLGNVLSSVLGTTGTSQQQSPLVQAALQLLQQNGGIGGIVDRFRQRRLRRAGRFVGLHRRESAHRARRVAAGSGLGGARRHRFAPRHFRKRSGRRARLGAAADHRPDDAARAKFRPTTTTSWRRRSRCCRRRRTRLASAKPGTRLRRPPAFRCPQGYLPAISYRPSLGSAHAHHRPRSRDRRGADRVPAGVQHRTPDRHRLPARLYRRPGESVRDRDPGGRDTGRLLGIPGASLAVVRGIFTDARAQRFAVNLAVAFLPAAILGPRFRQGDQGAPLRAGARRLRVRHRGVRDPVGRAPPATAPGRHPHRQRRRHALA